MTLISSMVSKLQADATLAAFISSTFSATLKFYVGVDDDEQPVSTNCPFIALRPGTMSAADDRSHRMIGINIALVINDAGDTASGQVITMAGLAKLQDFYFHVERVLDTWFQASEWNYTATYGETLLEMSRPLMRLSFTVTAQGDYQ